MKYLKNIVFLNFIASFTNYLYQDVVKHNQFVKRTK